jgi:AcrR family transcriptional regulator
MGRPKQHNDTIRLALLSAAEQLVNSGGPAALSVRAVADTVGTTTRAVYSVFGSKAGLLEALAIRLFELLADAIDSTALTADPIADLVTASLAGFRQVALAHSSLYSLVFLRVVPDLELGPRFDHIATAAFDRLESLVTRALATSKPGPISTRDAAHMVHALTEGMATMELRGTLGPPDHAEPHWQNAITALITGINRLNNQHTSSRTTRTTTPRP